MGLLNIGSTIIICTFELFMIYDLFVFAFEPRVNDKKKRLLAVVLLGMSILGINHFEIPLLNFLGGILLVFIFGKMLFTASIELSFLHSVLFYITSGCGEVVGEFLFSMIYQTKDIVDGGFSFHYFIIVLIDKTITFIILKVIQFFSKKYKVRPGKEMLRGFLVLPIATLFILYGIIKFDFYEDMFAVQRIVLGIGCTWLLFANAFVYYLLERFSTMMKQTKELEIISVKTAMERKHYVMLEEINQEHMNYIHDMNKNLSTIARLTEENQTQKVLELLEKLNIQICNVQKKQYCCDSILNSILLDRANVAVKQNIEFEVSVNKTIKMDEIEDLDKISMIGNLLDNAIEAAAKCTRKRKIRFEMFWGNKAYLVIRVKNTYEEKPKQLESIYMTSKRDKRNHGIGIKRVQEIAKKYGGMLENGIAGDLFVAKLYLATTGQIDN